MEWVTSTPLANSARRSRILPESHSISATPIGSPLRRSSVLNASLPIANDDLERTQRRKEMEIRKRLSSIAPKTASPLRNVSMDAGKAEEHLQICAKLFIENKITAKNVWHLHIIGLLKKLPFDELASSMKSAGTNLEIGSKIYGIRVDDVHAQTMRLAGTITNTARNNESPSMMLEEPNQLNNSGKKRKKRKQSALKRCTLDLEGTKIFGSMAQLEPPAFSTKEDVAISAVENLFTSKLPINPTTHKLELMGHDKYFPHKTDDIVSLVDPIQITLPALPKFNLCQQLRGFCLGEANVEEDIESVVRDAQGFPIAELDGSIHDIFTNDDPISTDEEDCCFENQNGLPPLEHIVDAIPEAERVETAYGYNSLVTTETGTTIERMWAGPHHWKFKYIRPSALRYSGKTEQLVTKNTKKTPKQVAKPINWDTFFSTTLKENNALLPTSSTYKPAPYNKITLPPPSLLQKKSLEKCCLTSKDITLNIERRRNTPEDHDQDNDLQYNYNNALDSENCTQGFEQDNGPMDHSTDSENPGEINNFQDASIDVPETVDIPKMQYALVAKKINIQKLKEVVWSNLSTGRDEIREQDFSSVYKAIGPQLPPQLRKDLSPHLALFAVLQLANENDLKLIQHLDCKNFTITKAKRL